MKRRNFIQYASSAFFLPLLLDGHTAKAHTQATTPFMKAMQSLADANDRILVVIQLNGGNDGLNMVIPLDQYSTYSASSFRGNIAIPEKKVLPLNGYAATGLHPSMIGLQRLFNDGKLSIVQAAGYPNPSFSHFRASDIWFTGVDSDKLETSGWLGRYVEETFPNFPDAYPNTNNPDPLAIQISSISSTVFNTSSVSSSLAIQDPDTFYNIIGTKATIIDGSLPNTVGGKYTAFLRQQQLASVAYAGQLKTAAGAGKNLVTYPSNNALADQLKIVARLIHGGSKTKIYYVTLGGFDTHASQVTTSDPTLGSHALLMQKVSEGITAFMDDLKAQGTQDKVAGMTFSEFGRRAISNGTYGTDHGWASPLFVFGNAVKKQMIGKNPDLKNLVNNNIALQNDFRQVYAAILQDWMGASTAAVKTMLLDKTFAPLPIFRADAVLATSNEMVNNLLIYPNPASLETIVEADIFAKSNHTITLISINGQVIVPPQERISNTQIRVDVSHFSSGKYILQVGEGETASRSSFLISR
ncbi:MAG: DUF1501 domain-containing protein [Spirosomataceae bacterium]